MVRYLVFAFFIMCLMIGRVGAFDGNFTKALAKEASSTIFVRADLDESNWLDINEYAALALVSSELMRLNQGVEVAVLGKGLTSVRVTSGPLDREQRQRLTKMTRVEFIMAAGDDFLLSQEEFFERTQTLFERADGSGDDSLQGAELETFLLALHWAHDVNDINIQNFFANREYTSASFE